jgi:hypothetical protein
MLDGGLHRQDGCMGDYLRTGVRTQVPGNILSSHVSQKPMCSPLHYTTDLDIFCLIS